MIGQSARANGQTVPISENVPSGALRVGRPRKFVEINLDKIRSVCPKVKSVRGLQNKIYMGRAISLFNNDDPKWKWFGIGTNGVKETVLAELGRMHDIKAMHVVAMKLVENPPETSRDAISLIRAIRNGNRWSGDAIELHAEIQRTIREYRGSHPTLGGWIVASALHMATARLPRENVTVARLNS